MTESPALKALFDSLPIVFKESREDDLREEEDNGQFSGLTKRGERRQDDTE